MEKILRMTLEIIRVLIGQEEFVIKKYGDQIIIEPSPHSPKRNDQQKILDLTHRMIEMLSGERLVDMTEEVMEKDPWAVCSSPDEPGITSRFPKSPECKEDMISEREQKFSGDVTLRRGSCEEENPEDGDRGRSVEHMLLCVKVEPNVTDPEDLSSLNIKEEAFYEDEGAFTEPGVSSFAQQTTMDVKEEPFSKERIEYADNNIKEEPSSGGEGILTDTDIYSPSSHIVKVKLVSCKEEGPRDVDDNIRLSRPLGASVRKKPGRKLNTSQIVEPHPDGMYYCRDCKKCYPTNSRLIKHQRVHRVKTVPCPQCGKTFSCNSALLRHQTAHTEEKPFACAECGKCMSSKPALRVHYRIHKGEKPFVCSDCGQQFLFKSHLIRHQVRHTGEKPFSCLECGKSYSSKAAIVLHQRLHTGDTAHPCPQCGRCFLQKNHLQQHMSSHTGEKPYTCSECGKHFVQKSNLKQHLSVHLPKKKETLCCPECGKCYKRRADFRWHLLIHLGEK